MTNFLRKAALVVIVFSSLLAAREPAARDYLKKSADWFASDEGKRIAKNILSHQAAEGGWPKNSDVVSKPFDGDRKELHGTFDNGATTDELRFLAHAFNATNDVELKDSFLRGLDLILKAQYPTGGWPQYYPPSKQYHRHITFNDNAMERLMQFLREVYSDAKLYELVDDAHKKSARDAFDKGIDCILNCQIRVNGKLTAWCAQHDEIDYSPRPARAFELVSLSGHESVGLARLLMSLDLAALDAERAKRIRDSVDAAAAWLESAKLTGIRIDTVDDPQAPKGKNKVVVADPKAPPIWARFYDIQTNKPFFSDRDSIAKPSLSDLGYERRNGYAWYISTPKDFLEKDYPQWKARYSQSRDRQGAISPR